MRVTEGAARLSGVAARRPLAALGIVVALAVAGGTLALGLRPSAATDTFVSASSPGYRATIADQRRFGSDAIVVLVRGPLTTLVQAGNLGRLTRLEACLAGEYVSESPTLRADVPVPAGSHAAYGGPASPCAALMREGSAQTVYGPGTFLNRAVAALSSGAVSLVSGARRAGDAAAAAADRLARARGASPRQARADAAAARQAEELQQLGRLEQLIAGTGLTGAPSITDAALVDRLVFGAAPAAAAGAGAGAPQPRLRYLFPDRDAALIQVRLRASLSPREQAQAIRWIREAVRMPMFALPAGDSYLVSGVPVVTNDLAGQITGAIGELLIAALLAMAATLLLVFRTARLRLLPLAVALLAAGITFGALAIAGVALTMASIAVLPILIGLAVDYGIQFQSRAEEARAEETRAASVRGGAAGGPSSTAPQRVVARATGAAVPAIATAALATATGFLVLLLSPVPMVRGFGVLLVVGIVVALGCALTAGSAALVLRESDGGVLGASLRGVGELLGPSLRGIGELLGPALRGARELAVGPARAGARVLGASLRGAAEIVGLRRSGRCAPVARGPERVLAGLVRHPGRVLAVGAVLAIAGWVADGHTAVQSDVTRLVPQSMPAMRGLRALEATTGVSGEIDVAVRGADVATPATVSWMSAYESRLLRHFGYGAGGSCDRATLCPALSLPDLFTGTGAGGASLTRAQIDGLLRAVPAYFTSAVLTPDHRAATLAFGIRLMPLARQQRVIRYMRAQLHPPPGVHAALTGLPVLAAQANAALSAPGRRLLTLVAGLVAVALVLLVALRRPARALAPMVPIVLATGWSALVLYLIGIPLNPMSATLGTLVIAISTEFSVLLSERFRQERLAGHEPAVALARTYRSTGRAVLASGITAIVGFGVLMLSDITMLRDFGLVTVVDLTVSLAGVLLVLPAALIPRPRSAPSAAGRRRGAVDRGRAGRRGRVAAGGLMPPDGSGS